MKKYQIMYIEKKANNHTGEAHVGKVTFSKTGRTIYYKDIILQHLRNVGVSANYFNVDTQEQYWVSGVKKNSSNRHWTGTGVVIIDQEAKDEFLSITQGLLPKNYKIEGAVANSKVG